MDIFRATITHEKSHGATILALLSDLHIDAGDHDREKLLADLESAKKLNARISINGDTFDAIVPSDRKRHHPMVNNVDGDDIFNRIIRSAVEILKPYANLIDIISPGNHERSVLKYHHIDLTSMLIFGLNCVRDDKLPPIHQGSYRGFQQYTVNYSSGSRAVHNFIIFRHHGVGGSAPVTGGALDLDRIRKDFDANLYWIGHKHQSIGRKFTRYSLSSNGNLLVNNQRAVISGGYKRQLSVENPALDGDIADFSESFYQVTEQGAQWVLIETRTDARTTTTGFINGVRWSISDSPNQLLMSLTA